MAKSLAPISLIFILLLQACPRDTDAPSDRCLAPIEANNQTDRRRTWCESGNCSLFEAINFANWCGGDRDYTIQLFPGTYVTGNRVASDPGVPTTDTFGSNGYPAITSNITINGADATINRAPDGSFGSTENYRLFYVAEGYRLTINNATLENGKAHEPQSSTLAVTTPADRGGAIYNFGTLELNSVVLRENEARHVGGAVYNRGSMTTRNSQFLENRAANSGGAIFVPSEKRATITETLFSHNRGGISGGGINVEAYANVSIDRSTFTSNAADSDNGGAILNYGNLTIRRSSFDYNRAGINGGAIRSLGFSDGDPAMLHISNTTFAGNRAVFEGGAIYAILTDVTLLDSTLTINSDGIAGPAQYTIRNSIIALNTSRDCAGSMSINTGGSNNIDGNTGTCGFNITVYPTLNFGPFEKNGGSTKNYLPDMLSAALDAGSECLATDQRGFSRPVDGNGDGSAICDIGAVERQEGEGGMGGSGDDKSDDDKDGGTPTPDTPPVVTITSPQSGASFLADKFDKDNSQWFAAITLTGTGTDAEDGSLTGGSLVWTVFPANHGATTLGTGGSITINLYAPACFGNSYTITLTGTDSDGNAVSDLITLISSQFC